MKLTGLNFSNSDASCHSLRLMAEAVRSGEWLAEGDTLPGGAVSVTLTDRSSRNIESEAEKAARRLDDCAREFATGAQRSSNAKVSTDYGRLADMCRRQAERLRGGG